MSVIALEVGPLAACCYIVCPDQPAAPGAPPPAVVVDPGDEAEKISAHLKRLGAKLETILLTHSHVDHITATDRLRETWPGAVLLCSQETSRRIGDPLRNLSVMMGAGVKIRPADRFIGDGESFEAAGMQWRALEIPGHDPGEMVFILGDDEAVFSGDTVFAGSIGRSDFPGGDGGALIDGVNKLLSALKPDTPIYPGHGPATTVSQELAYNPFLGGRY